MAVLNLNQRYRKPFIVSIFVKVITPGKHHKKTNVLLLVNICLCMRTEKEGESHLEFFSGWLE